MTRVSVWPGTYVGLKSYMAMTKAPLPVEAPVWQVMHVPSPGAPVKPEGGAVELAVALWGLETAKMTEPRRIRKANRTTRVETFISYLLPFKEGAEPAPFSG
jgi:hypothetical protein